MASERTRLVLTKVDGTVINVGTSGGGATVSLLSRPLQMLPNGKQCYVDGAKLDFEGTSYIVNGTVRFGWSDALDDDVNWSDAQDLADANTIYDLHMEGRFFHVELIDSQVQGPWKLSAIEFYGRPLRGRTK